MASQKYWEDDVQVSDGSGSVSIDCDQEEEILSKAECELFFREEVRAWLDDNGKDLFGNGLPIPHVIKTDVTKTPYKPPYKKQKAGLLTNEALTPKTNKTYFTSNKTV